MPAFHFRLQTLLKLRLADRERRQLLLAEALRAEQILRGNLEQVGTELAEIRQQARQLTAPGLIDVDGALQINRFELQLKAQQSILRQQMSQLADEIQRRRAVLLESDRQVRVLEKMREHKQEEYVREADRAESKELDEVAQRGRRYRAGEQP